MEQLPWHEYSGESAEELFALAATHRTDSLVVAFETALRQKADRRGVAALSQPEMDVLAIEALEREVNNGGYRQFFFNAAEYAGQIVDALERAGCAATAAITGRAIAAFPAGTTLSATVLEALMANDDEGRDAELQRCDEAYYSSGEDIAARVWKYALANRHSIDLRGQPTGKVSDA